MDDMYRSRDNKVIAGVCAGVARRFEMDPNLVRILTVVASLFTGIPIILYIVGIFVLPMEPEGGTDSAVSRSAQTGGTASAAASVGSGKNMADHVRILGILYIVLSSISLAAVLFVFVLIAGGGLASGDSDAMVATGIVGAVIVVISLVFIAPGMIGGIGLLKRQNWARIMIMVISLLQLLNFPFGTALGVYALWTLNHKDTSALFGGEQFIDV